MREKLQPTEHAIRTSSIHHTDSFFKVLVSGFGVLSCGWYTAAAALTNKVCPCGMLALSRRNTLSSRSRAARQNGGCHSIDILRGEVSHSLPSLF